MSESRRFPVLYRSSDASHCPDSPEFVEWSKLSEQQARKNHGQTLERLAERGGLCPLEIAWNIKGLEWRDHVSEREVAEILESVAYQEPNSSTPPTE